MPKTLEYNGGITVDLSVTVKLECLKIAQKALHDDALIDDVFSHGKKLAEYCLDPSQGMYTSLFPAKNKNTNIRVRNKK